MQANTTAQDQNPVVELLEHGRPPEGWTTRRDDLRGGLVLEHPEHAPAFIDDQLLIDHAFRQAFGGSTDASSTR
jgi:hypothetical protein